MNDTKKSHWKYLIFKRYNICVKQNKWPIVISKKACLKLGKTVNVIIVISPYTIIGLIYL